MKGILKIVGLILMIVITVISLVLFLTSARSIAIYRDKMNEAIESKETVEASFHDDVGDLVDCYVLNSDVIKGSELTSDVITSIQIPRKVIAIQVKKEVESEGPVEEIAGFTNTQEKEYVYEQSIKLVTSGIGDQYDLSNMLGKKFKIDLTEGTLLMADFLEDSILDDSARYYTISFDQYPIGLRDHDVIDIRIKFALGQDCVALPYKEVLKVDYSRSLFTFIFTEEEANIYNSMLIDKAMYDGVSIYCTKYIDKNSQSAAQAFYNVNRSIITAMQQNPNLNIAGRVDQIISDRQKLNSIIGDSTIDVGTEAEIDQLKSKIESQRKALESLVNSAATADYFSNGN